LKDRGGAAYASAISDVLHNNIAATLADMLDLYDVSFRRAEVNFMPGGVVPPIATTDAVKFDRWPPPEERAALLA
jgi:hypothetical protein